MSRALVGKPDGLDDSSGAQNRTRWSGRHPDGMHARELEVVSERVRHSLGWSVAVHVHEQAVCGEPRQKRPRLPRLRHEPPPNDVEAIIGSPTETEPPEEARDRHHQLDGELERSGVPTRERLGLRHRPREPVEENARSAL